MADALTTTYKFTQPEVGGSDDTWGDKLNTNWGKVDTLLTETFPAGGATTLGQTFTVRGFSPSVRLEETDQTDPAGRFRLYGNNGDFYFQRATSAGWGATSSIWSYVGGEFTISSPVVMGSTLTVAGGLGRLKLDGTSPYIWLHDSDGLAATRNYMLTANTGSVRIANADDAGATVATLMTLSDTEILTTSRTRLATVGGIVEVGHSTVANLEFQRAGIGYIKWPNAGSVLAQTDTGNNVMSLAATQFATYPLTRLAIGGGIVEIGHSTVASIEFQYAGTSTVKWPNAGSVLFQTATGNSVMSVAAAQFASYPLTRLAIGDGNVEIGLSTNADLSFKRTGGPGYLTVPVGESLRVKNASAVVWASVSSASGWAAGTSDVRLKQNVAPIHYGLDTVLALRPIQFDWIADARHDIGFSAQDIEKIIPEIVEVWEADPNIEGEIDTYAMRKDALVAVLVRAVQELAARVETLEGA